MTLEELERGGYVKRLPEDKKKVEDALNLAKRDIKIAKTILRDNDDWTFSIAYNAMLQAIRNEHHPTTRKEHDSIIRSSGCRFHAISHSIHLHRPEVGRCCFR